MFGGRKIKAGAHGFGALRSASPVTAPQLKFEARGRDSSVDLRKFCSEVENQGELMSCNACAVVSALEFLMKKGGKPVTDLSVLYVFYYARKMAGNEKKNMGVLCHHATAAAMAYGACEDRLWPYKEDKFDQEPPERARQESRSFDAVQYARLATSDEAKLSLGAGVPVLFGLDMPAEYYHATGADGKMPGVGTYDDKPMAGHTMLIVGYDDQDKTWLAQNSWGKEWGDKGFVKMPYDLVSKYAWNDELWAIGALESVARAKLVGPSVQQAVSETQEKAPREVNEALAKLGKEIGEELDKRVSDAKTSIRDRLRAQEAELEAKRKRD